MIEQDPYLTKTITTEIKEYNPDYGDDRICICGHPYHRHFDSYNDMENTGCKYCLCTGFIEKRVKVMTDIEKQIKEKEEELNELLERKSEFESLTVEQQLATKLHKMLCINNHTDGCAWYYRETDWTEHAHERYLQMAMDLLELEEDVDKIITIAKVIKKLR